MSPPYTATMRPTALTLALLLATAPAFAQDAAPADPFAPGATALAAAGNADASTQSGEPGTAADAQAAPSAGEPPVDAAPADPAAAPTEAPIDATPAGAVAAQAAADDPRTDAERDFDALYNPVADPTLPAPAQTAEAYDPWERTNRRVHRFNQAVDRTVAKPLARAYVAVVPRPVRLGVSNFFSNLGQPVSAINALLQGKPVQAAQATGRFLLNSTLGIGGIFDPASDANLPRRSEDFGQTLGVWGWKRSRYVELPLFGPRTVRDTFGLVGDAPLSPLRQVDADRIRIPLQGLQLVDTRAQLLAIDSLRDGAGDDYALVRDAWLQRRDYQIFGDRMNGEELPEYLRDETNPTVPADAMPVMPQDIN